MTILGIASADYLRADRAEDGKDHWGGAGWARIGQYVDHYRALGYDVVVGTLWREENSGVSVEDASGRRVRPDIVIAQRLMHDTIDEAIRYARAAGQVVINDLDDWYWGLDPSNEAFKSSHPKLNLTENTTFYRANIAASSLVTVSTPYLAERIKPWVRCPIVHVPNYIDVLRFSTHTQQETPVYGWAGSTGHRSGDLETIAQIMRPRITSGLRAHHSGDHEGYPKVAELWGVDPPLITTTPRVETPDYPSILNFDVGLVPLRDTPFNLAKSEIKGLEYAAAGIPFIAQALPSYATLHKDWGGCFHLADRPKDWIKGINRYQSLDQRLEDQQRLLDAVKGRDIQYGIKHWTDVLQNARP